MRKPSHLELLEAESIHIIREVMAECRRPVILHLAMKVFYPSTPPFPLMHVDTTWKFREMIAFRDSTAVKCATRNSRREGRVMGHDGEASMEPKKREHCFR